MASHHALVDEVTVRLGSLFVADSGFFSRNVDSPRIKEMLSAVSPNVPPLGREGLYELAAETPVGTLDVGIKVTQWLGSDSLTIVYHPGNDERPFSSSRFTPNT